MHAQATNTCTMKHDKTRNTWTMNSSSVTHRVRRERRDLCARVSERRLERRVEDRLERRRGKSMMTDVLDILFILYTVHRKENA